MKIKTIQILLIITALLFLSTNTYSVENQDKQLEKIDYYSNKFKAILETIVKNYDDSVNIEVLTNKCFNAMLTGLDPFSRYFSPDEYKRIIEEQSGTAEEIGVTIISLRDTLTVLSINKNSPAELAGIAVGDKIIFIDGKNAVKMSANDANSAFRGKIGTSLDIIIKRNEGNNLMEFKLTRGEIEIPGVLSEIYLENEKAAYIKMLRFGKKTIEEVNSALDSLIKLGAEALVLDLRDNPGGLLDAAIELCNEFAAKGDTILSIKSRNPIYNFTYTADIDGKYAKLPVIILVNESTASASEIFAGMMQDLDRGIVIGKITTGKGLVQKVWNYTDTSAFRITIAKYFTPSGRLLQKPYSTNNEKQQLSPELEMDLDEKAKASIKEMLKFSGGKSSLPTFSTRKGRTVIGGGGIFPDVLVHNDTTTLLMQVLKSNAVFLDYSLDIYKEFGKSLKDKYENYAFFSKTYRVSDEFLDNFKNYFKSRNIWNEAMYETDKEQIRNYLKANIAYFLFGDYGFYTVLNEIDKQYLEAIKSISQAKSLINLQRN